MDESSAWLEFPGGERIFLEDLCAIGRSPANQVVVTSERVSRKHAMLRRAREGTYELTDLGSSNGTYVNGNRVASSVILADGSVIEIGLQKITFRHPPARRAASGGGSPLSECWLLVVDATERGCRTPSEGALDKTRESWNERVQRIVKKFRGTSQRALNEGLLAYWITAETDANTAPVVASALESLRRVQLQTEEFRFVLHHGEVQIDESVSQTRALGGPEVIYVMQLQRLARSADVPLLITESARDRLDGHFETRPLGKTELRGYSGKKQFYTAA